MKLGRIVVPFPPGGTTDLVARMVQPKFAEFLGQPVVIENKGGAGGSIGATEVARSAADGYTLLMVFDTHGVNHHLYKQAPDPFQTLEHICLMVSSPSTLVAGTSFAPGNLKDVMTRARADPGKVTYGSVGARSSNHLGALLLEQAGGPAHFFGVMLARATGVDLVLVPYKGGAPLVTDLVGGQVPAGILLISDLIKQHESGKVRMLGSFGAQRSPATPNVPTFKELGFAALEGAGWHAFHTTAGTPRPTIDRLSKAIASAIKAPEVSERLLALGLEPVGSTPEELGSRVAEDTARWAPVVRASGFRADE